ncbi:hypothetical protein GOP47_0013069 [Adiantum capillus-veneris]|uniref:Pentatricopeptide repeat-containing protein n=1 Tax=Adiantum capillus-veneris TaxID=13818 RepID=A0A9D4UT93_ADICA|nr:hypothetical protein GOP47_0013069 [Adiantum capillus-veneris]
MHRAQKVFPTLVHCDNRAWNSVISHHVKNGEFWRALAFYQEKQKDVSFDALPSTYVVLLKACSKLKDWTVGFRIHAEVARRGLFNTDVFIGSSLIDMYAKCGYFTKAQEAFDDLLVQNTVSWTTLIASYVEAGCGEEALYYLKEMQQYDGISMDEVTFVWGLKACGIMKSIEKGREIHEGIINSGVEGYLVTGSTLVDMYAKCGFLAEARYIFEKLQFQDVVSWTALMGGYAEHGLGEEALSCFQEMRRKGIAPDAGMFVCCLQACGSIKTSHKGQELHADVAKFGLEMDLFVGGALVDMLVKCGLLDEAQCVFNKLAMRNVVLWTTLITGYIECGHAEEALDCYDQMEKEGISSVSATLIGGLKGCGGLGAIRKGRKIHSNIVNKGFESELLAGNTLVDMYAKCGSLGEAQAVFSKLAARSLISWTALITGYAQLGESKAVFDIFGRMLKEGILPNSVTIVNILNVCSHSGLMAEGLMCFEYASLEYGLVPSLEHYTCIVDLLGRAGHLDKAVAVIQKMPCHPGVGLWLSVLGACRKWGDLEIGRLAFECATGLDEKESAAYVGMRNIYADSALQEGHWSI